MILIKKIIKDFNDNSFWTDELNFTKLIDFFFQFANLIIEIIRVIFDYK